MLAIYNLVMNLIAKFILQRFQDYLKGISLVMGYEVFHILKQKGPWFLFSNYSGNVKKQRSLGSTFKPVRMPKGVFF